MTDSDLIKEKDRQIKHLNSMVEEWKGIADDLQKSLKRINSMVEEWKGIADKRLEMILEYKELLKNK